ncbi:MAG: RNA-binding transcriptional accessory protein [Nitrococcus sp.]|nr:RNA-binding transcriptional accessory protein [Nitrococcus sp.]
MAQSVVQRIAAELQVNPSQVAAAIGLLDEGATVPFIARYRKEATEGLDDNQLRELEQRLSYQRGMDERREVILKAIGAQGKLTAELADAIGRAESKTGLEDLYLPFKKKRRTKGEIAREAGLAPLAQELLADPSQNPQTRAAHYLNAEQGITDPASALEGARFILAERLAEDAALLHRLREHAWQHGLLVCECIDSAAENAAKFSDYVDYREAIRKIPSHRALALLRGRRERVLRLRLVMPDELDGPRGAASAGERMIAAHLGLAEGSRPGDRWLAEMVRFTWRVKLLTRLETDLFARLKAAADSEAIRVFGRNLRDLLLAAPAGAHVVLGIDPGLRTGCKVAVVDATGKLLSTTTIYPHAPKHQWAQAIASLAALAQRYQVTLVAIGNGTASRETHKLVGDLARAHPGLGLTDVMVSEAGASVYSASQRAADEFPDLDVSLRGAVSIARRVQDPLAELVKIEPRSIGVGQYQHDVGQTELASALDTVVEDCVNAVGVDLNTASAALLTHVSGLSPALAERVIAYRDDRRGFRRRDELKAVSRFGAKTYEQAAGFLRIRDGEQPLDASAVHPEAYAVVERIATARGCAIAALIGNVDLLRTINPADFTDERFGIPTVTDILRELEKPGRDPRPEFRSAHFRDGVETLGDLVTGMILEGVVTNVTNFGAFVDIGVHQDGLVHISAMAEHFVRDPREVTKPGDVVKVRVVEVDLARKRIALSMRLTGDGPRMARGKRDSKEKERGPATAMAAAFKKHQHQ